MNRWYVSLGVLWLLVTPVRADVSGQTTWNGHTVSYQVAGQSTSASSDASPAKYVLHLNSAGQVHKITITATQLEWNGKVARLGDFKKIAISIDGKAARFEVDGKPIKPAAKKNP